MKRLILSFLTLLLFNCTNNPERFIPFLEGYWEISEVTLPDGTKKWKPEFEKLSKDGGYPALKEEEDCEEGD